MESSDDETKKSESEISNDDEMEVESKPEEEIIKKKKRKRGIVYLSSIPKYMNVALIKNLFGEYGSVGRVYLQLSDHDGKFFNLWTKTEKKIINFWIPANEKKRKKKNRCNREFSEGWIEFLSKRVAKQIAASLNGTQVAHKKSSKFYDILWNIKYLPRFKWIHLSERITYEKAVYKQKLRTEVSQARREATFFQNNLDKSEMVAKRKKREKAGNSKAKEEKAT